MSNNNFLLEHYNRQKKIEKILIYLLMKDPNYLLNKRPMISQFFHIYVNLINKIIQNTIFSIEEIDIYKSICEEYRDVALFENNNEDRDYFYDLTTTSKSYIMAKNINESINNGKINTTEGIKNLINLYLKEIPEEHSNIYDYNKYNEFLFNILFKNYNYYSTNYDKLDENISGGIRVGDLTVICGGPGSGKTTIALNIIVNTAERLLKEGKCVYYVSPDMQISYLYKRLYCIKSNKPYNSLSEDNYSDIENELKEIPIIISEHSEVEIILSYIEQNKDRIKMVIIDYIQLLRIKHEVFNSRNEEISNVIDRFKNVCKIYNLALIFIAHIRRDSLDFVTSKSFDVSRIKIKDCSNIEQDSDLILYMENDSRSDNDEMYYGMKEELRATIEKNSEINSKDEYSSFTLYFKKNRHGKQGLSINYKLKNNVFKFVEK